MSLCEGRREFGDLCTSNRLQVPVVGHVLLGGGNHLQVDPTFLSHNNKLTGWHKEILGWFVDDRMDLWPSGWDTLLNELSTSELHMVQWRKVWIESVVLQMRGSWPYCVIEMPLQCTRLE